MDLWGGTSGTFAGLDQFNRIIDQRWQNNVTSTPTDIDRYQYGYDQNSNRTYKGNVVAHAAGVYLDEVYAYDNLNRLTQMQRGNLSGGAITGTPAREMDYTLDPTGNWSNYLTKTNGMTDLTQTRTANKVNEITAIGGTPGWATPPAYDAAGNMTSFPQPASPSSNFTATYDAWNRMVSINNSSGSVATYQYDGRGRRIVKYTASTSETRHFYYTDQWQDIEERTGTSTTMDKQYVWGLRYIDELVCRDDATTSPPQRLYAMQDANFNLTSICNTSGGVVERYRFDPYGTRTIMNASWGTISTSSYAWSIGFQGLYCDAGIDLIYMRTRWLQSSLGWFGNRSPWGYNHQERNLYDFANANPVRFTEPFSEPIEVGGVVIGAGSAAVIAAAATLGISATACLSNPACQRLALRNAEAAAAAAAAARATGREISKCWHWIVNSTLDDCIEAAASTAAWIAFCKTLPMSLRPACYDKGGEGVSPTNRQGWCKWHF